jgi:hypothetical protein
MTRIASPVAKTLHLATGPKAQIFVQQNGKDSFTIFVETLHEGIVQEITLHRAEINLLFQWLKTL